MSSQQETSNPLLNQDRKAYIIMVFAGYTFTFGYMLGTEHKQLNAGLVSFWRGFSTALFNYLLIRYFGKDLSFSNAKDLYKLNWRSFYCALHGVVMSLSLYFLSPPIVHTINASGPVLVFIIDYLRNGVHVSMKQIVGICIGSIGITATINSGLLCQWLNLECSSHSRFEYVDVSIVLRTLLAALLLLCQIGWGYALVITKQIKSYDAYQISFHYGVFQSLTGGVFSYYFGSPPNYTVVTILQVFLWVGLPLGLANFLLTYALKITKKSGNVTMMMFNNVVTGYLISIFRYNQTPNLFGVAGSLCIFLGLVLVVT